MEDTKPIFTGRTYDTIKQIAQYWLPAAGALYFALAGIWGFPYGEQVIGTITAVDVFLGVLIGVSKSQYNKSEMRFDGALVVDDDEVDNPHALEFKQELSDLANQKTVTLKVNRVSH